MSKVVEISKKIQIKRIAKNGVRFYEINDTGSSGKEKILYPSVSTVLSIIDQPSFKAMEKSKFYNFIKNSFEKSNQNGIGMSIKEHYMFKKQRMSEYEEKTNNVIKYGSIIGTDAHNQIEEIIETRLKEDKKKELKPLESLIETKDALHIDEEDEITGKKKKKTKSEEALENTTIPKELLRGAPFKVQNVRSSFEKWEKSSGLTLEHNDTLVFSNKYKFAGACDAIARKPNGELVVIDWKTSSSLSLNYALQVSAYSKAIEEMTGEKISEAWIVKFDKNHPTFDTYSVKDIDGCFNSFLAALNLWNTYNIDKYEETESFEVHFFNHIPFASRCGSNIPNSTLSFVKENNENKNTENNNNENNNNENRNTEKENTGNKNIEKENTENGFRISYSQSGGIIIPDAIKIIKTNK
ncbi:hypothetical protein ACTA71_011151 [Dictyostelium dimigraforme]